MDKQSKWNVFAVFVQEAQVSQPLFRITNAPNVDISLRKFKYEHLRGNL